MVPLNPATYKIVTTILHVRKLLAMERIFSECILYSNNLRTINSFNCYKIERNTHFSRNSIRYSTDHGKIFAVTYRSLVIQGCCTFQHVCDHRSSDSIVYGVLGAVHIENIVEHELSLLARYQGKRNLAQASSTSLL